MINIILSILFVVFLVLVLLPEQKETVVEKEANNSPVYNIRDHYVSTVEAWQDARLMDDLRFGDREIYTVSLRSNLELPFSYDFKEGNDLVTNLKDFQSYTFEDDIDWDNLFIPTESPVHLSRRKYFQSERRAQFGGIKTKWSSIYGREFGNKRKRKIKRANARFDKRFYKYTSIYDVEQAPCDLDERDEQIEAIWLR